MAIHASELKIGTTVDILFDVQGKNMPFEGVIIAIRNLGIDESGEMRKCYSIRFSDGDWKQYRKHELLSLVRICKKWKEDHQNHDRGDPSSYSSKDTTIEENMLKIQKTLNAIHKTLNAIHKTI